MTKAAVFDLDGVLLDSMGIWNDLGARYLRSLGVTPEEGLNEILFSMSMEQGAEYLHTHYALPQSAAEVGAGIADMLRDDITATFRDEYLGKYRNSKANQMLFISAVNYYFDTLASAASNYVLNPDHDNKAGIDVTAQRNAWIGSGKAEAADWDDATVMATPFKRMVYLSGDVQILGCMGGLEFAVTLM